jgi:hypothetical protein
LPFVVTKPRYLEIGLMRLQHIPALSDDYYLSLAMIFFPVILVS